MTLSRAIFGSALILAFAIILASINPAESQRRADGYMIAASGQNGQFIWRVNTTTGAVSYCVRRDNSLDAVFIARRPPYCSASSPPMASGQ
ncbi:MAG: hypothetical protein AAF569_07970 [Pseudomonadota bacterium]